MKMIMEVAARPIDASRRYARARERTIPRTTDGQTQGPSRTTHGQRGRAHGQPAGNPRTKHGQSTDKAGVLLAGGMSAMPPSTSEPAPTAGGGGPR